MTSLIIQGEKLLVPQASDYLPAPPNDAERDLYFGPQHRWVPAVSFFSTLIVAFSVWLFVGQRPWAAFLLIPIALNLIGSLVSLITSSRRRRLTFAQHRALVEGWKPDYPASVDVLLPTAGEELEVLLNTYEHVSKLRWHGELHVIVLDDADRPEVKDAALFYGFEYHVRENRGYLKKAGNLLAGYKRTHGDFILVLDADFVPRADIFYELVPYMDDSEIGIVQSPQYFDVDPSMGWVQRAAAATQVLFYRWVQPSRDKSNAAICVGTCAIYRRAALDEVGGFAQIGHSEDVHTGVKLMSAGYQVRYVPTLVAKGLCPDAFDQFVTQQYRWCTGSMSLLFSKSFHQQGFTKMQRLCYWSGFLYFIGTGVNIFVLSIPPVLMGLFAPGGVNPTNYALVLLALAIRAGTIPMITMGRGAVISIARIQATYSFSHALALYDHLRQRTDSWVATGEKVRSRTAERVGRASRRWCIAVQAALWIVLLWRVPEYGLDHYWPLLLLTLLNLYIVVPIIARRDVKGFA